MDGGVPGDDAVPREEMRVALEQFWEMQRKEQAEELASSLDGDGDTAFKNHNDLPLARIKRIMKSDEDVRMIRAETPVLFARACELFILELTIRAWCFAEKAKRRNLHKEDVQAAVAHTEIFDFLVEVINTPDGGATATAAAGGAPAIAAAAAPAPSAAPALPAMMGGGQAGMMGAMAGAPPQHQMQMGAAHSQGMGMAGHAPMEAAGAPGAQAYPMAGGAVAGQMQHGMAQGQQPQPGMAGAPMQHMGQQQAMQHQQQYVQNGAPPQL